MPDDHIENWLAERIFDCVTPDGTKGTFRTAIGFPKQVGDTEEWQCAYVFDAFFGDRIKYISGADALQALTCALAIMMIDIRDLQDTPGYNVTFEGQTNLLLGLPDITFSRRDYVEDEEEPDET